MKTDAVMQFGAPEERLLLYRRAGKAMNAFFGRWTDAFCRRCLEVTARGHSGEQGAAMELVWGRYAGCCQAGVADSLTVPCAGGGVGFPEDLAELMQTERAALGTDIDPPQTYTLLEPDSDRMVEGRGCRHLGDAGCRLGDLKAPLCLTYVCPAVRDALEDAAGPGCCGDGKDDDNFCGSVDALRAVVAGSLEEAEGQVAGLAARVEDLGSLLEVFGVRSGRELRDRWFHRPRESEEAARQEAIQP